MAAIDGDGRGRQAIWDLVGPLTLSIAASHGFGFFLFPALLPATRAEVGLTYTSAAYITAAAQAAYMVGSVAAMTLGPRIGAGRLMLGTTCLTAACLFALAGADSAPTIGILIATLAASAALNWTSIAALSGHHVPVNRRALALAVVSSGTAWGVSINGVSVSFVVPAWGVAGAWTLAGGLALATAALAGLVLARRGALGPPTATPTVVSPDTEGTPEPAPSSAWRAALWWLRKPAVFYACLFSALIGLSAMPYSTYLGAYLQGEVGHPATLAGAVWSLIGFSGVAAGLGVGWFATRYGVRASLCTSFLLFFAGALILVLSPHPPVVFAASVFYGIMYFTFWGLIAAYVTRAFTPETSMRVIGASLICFGTVGALANWAGGLWAASGGSFAVLYGVVAGLALIMALLAFGMPRREAAR
ncbi:MAG: MFS transporter [Rhodospirillales bacterium]|jgi:MFS family permease|nr:MFS transporter [Rhodospirillales bacterium]